MTFSLVGRCARTGLVGVAVSSSSPCVAARCAHVRAGVGAAGSQNITDPSLGPRLLDRLAAGRSGPEALDDVLAGAAHAEYRQLLVVDGQGRTAVHSGEQTLGRHSEAQGVDCASAGNLLADDAVPAEMVAAFEGATDAHLAERLVRALEAGAGAGGEVGAVRSAGLLVADRVSWPVADLRVDWHETPIGALRDLWELWRPQLDDYVMRALDPRLAPTYGVPGDP